LFQIYAPQAQKYLSKLSILVISLCALAVPSTKSGGHLMLNTQLLKEVLKPYITKGCQYLLDIVPENGGLIGQFSIKQSVYVEDSGHFNAVEALICSNQIIYTFIALELLAESGGKEKYKTFLEDPDAYLIYLCEFTFRHLINPKNFRGSVKKGKAKSLGRKDYVTYHIRFWDDDGGSAFGEVRGVRVK
jgi:hypothetical protein